MNWKRHFAEAATLILAAILCAVVSNAFASRERKMLFVGTYPNALKVPSEAPTTPVAPLTATASTTASETATAVTPATTTVSSPSSTQPAPVSTSTSAPIVKPSAAAHATATPPSTSNATKASPTPAAPEVHPASKFTPHPDKQYIEVGYDDAAALFKEGALVLDARRTNVYEQGHIAGAQSFSVWEADIDDKVRALWEKRQDPKEQALPILIYCSGGDCEDSHMLAGKLFGALFSNVYVYKDGFPDWQKHNAAIHTGSAP